jgi:hypothetical protein
MCGECKRTRSQFCESWSNANISKGCLDLNETKRLIPRKRDLWAAWWTILNSAISTDQGNRLSGSMEN